MLYKGWVPTVIGRLSFRSIGDTSFPDRSISSNITISDGAKRDRYIFAFQRRRLGDTAFPAITNSILGLNGSFYFTLASVSDDHEPNNNKLLGAICIFIQPNWSLAKDEARSLVRCDPTDVAQYKEQWATLTSHISRHADCIVNFTLFRNGNCEFSKPQIHSEAFQEMEDGDICNQAYSFLRDITRAHQHHDPSADTLLTVRTVAEDENSGQMEAPRHVFSRLLFG